MSQSFDLIKAETNVRLTISTSILAIALSYAGPGRAQIFSRADLGSVAQTAVRQCDSGDGPSAGANALTASELGVPLATFAAQTLGDAATAAVNTLGTVLEEASRARTFAATGYASFDFYKVDTPATGDTRLVPAFADVAHCLYVNVPGSLSLVARLEARPDGFQVIPVRMTYSQPLPRAPRNRPLPAELHISFATPGVRTDSSEIGPDFAVARIPLPEVQPNAGPINLERYESAVLPMRPNTGAAGDYLAALANAETDYRAKEATFLAATRALAHQRLRTPTPATPDERIAMLRLEETREDALQSRDQAFARRDALSGLGNGTRGSVNLQVRFVLIRDENGFLKAIANSLKTRSGTLGAGLTAALTPEPVTAAWTEKETQYVAAMNTVAIKQAALNLALEGVDQNLIMLARNELRSAQALANAAAAAAERQLPFPNLLVGL